jgi:hypothetical protein
MELALRMGIKVEHKQSGQTLYFLDGDSYDKYMQQDDENNYEYYGFQMVPDDVEIIDMNSEFTEFRKLCAAVGVDPNVEVVYDEEEEKKATEKWIDELEAAGVVRKLDVAPETAEGKRLYKPMTEKDFIDRLLENAKQMIGLNPDSTNPQEVAAYQKYTTFTPELHSGLVYDLFALLCSRRDYKIRVDRENVVEAGSVIKFNEKLGMPYIQTAIGGDWEYPVSVIIYIGSDDKYRVYIPKQGNTFNTLNNAAFGNDLEGKDLERLRELGFDVKTPDDIGQLIESDGIDKLFDQALFDQDIETNFVTE